MTQSPSLTVTQSQTPPPSARTPAQRQADRHRRLQRDCEYKRVNVWLDISAYFALKRLARRDAVTQAEVIASLIKIADQKILDTLDERAPEWDEYFGCRRLSAGTPEGGDTPP
ncbi:MAG: hypothetical protein RJA99_3796 [Pseudomonadota bacterium]